jgi:phosphoribosylanthranilate isomerase
MTTKIKVCGVTSPQDAELVIEAGADLMGLIFVPTSPRHVKLKQAMEIIAVVQNRIQVVGVFQDSPSQLTLDYLEYLRLDYVQFHGAEIPELCQSMPIPVIKTFSFSGQVDWGRMRHYNESCRDSIHYMLLDRPKGVACADWLEQVADFHDDGESRLPYFLAGGMTPNNVAKVVEIIQPDGIDVASGVECEPGVKDPAKVMAFCQAVRDNVENGGLSQCNL